MLESRFKRFGTLPLVSCKTFVPSAYIYLESCVPQTVFCTLAVSGKHNQNSPHVPATFINVLTTGSLLLLISELGIIR